LVRFEVALGSKQTMYIPAHFREARTEEQHALIRDYPLGLLITTGAAGLQASPLPFHLVTEGPSLGILQTHLSRANPHWMAIDGLDALVVFQGSDAYITPSWYQSKEEHGKVVPTWNYAMVQARGRVKVIEEQGWLRAQITRLTGDHESRRAAPWHVTDAPPAFIDAQIKGIVGLEIEIGHLEGKWKVSQNRPDADRPRVADGLDSEGRHVMSDLVRRYGGLDSK
jgi:transcriptional regulator